MGRSEVLVVVVFQGSVEKSVLFFFGVDSWLMGFRQVN